MMYQKQKQLSGGLINDTWLALEDHRQIIVQRVNTEVFKNPAEVMENMVGITKHLQARLLREGRDPQRETLTFLPDSSGQYLTYTEEGVFRKSLYIPDTYTLLKPGSPEEMREAGRLYGDFQRLLADYPIETLHETLPGFHDTARRYDHFLEAIAENRAGRAADCQKEIEQLQAFAPLATHFTDCSLPIRVTHNDTNIATLLFDRQTGKALAVIDLETVMPGLAVHDFGDAIRSGASSKAEDDPDIDGVHLVPELYEAFREGFLAGTAGTLTEAEISELEYGAAVIIFEQAIRFLTDYLNGDVYYKTAYPEHNLVRAQNQRKLLESLTSYISVGGDPFLKRAER